MKTIARNHIKKIAQIFNASSVCIVYSLSNNFCGELCSKAAAQNSLVSWNARLTENIPGAMYRVHVHSNLWYDLHVEPFELKEVEHKGDVIEVFDLETSARVGCIHQVNSKWQISAGDKDANHNPYNAAKRLYAAWVDEQHRHTCSQSSEAGEIALDQAEDRPGAASADEALLDSFMQMVSAEGERALEIIKALEGREGAIFDHFNHTKEVLTDSMTRLIERLEEGRGQILSNPLETDLNSAGLVQHLGAEIDGLIRQYVCLLDQHRKMQELTKTIKDILDLTPGEVLMGSEQKSEHAHA